MNTNRRTFRGRGGPTDRRLPKNNARRRKANEAQEAIDPGEADNVLVLDRHRGNAQEFDSLEEVEEEVLCEKSMDVEDEDEQDDGEDELQILPSKQPKHQHPDSLPPLESTSPTSEDPTEKSRKEMEHLNKRIKKLHESIRLSANGITNPSTYQQNVLHVVAKCVHEWGSILRFYIPKEFRKIQTEDDESSQTISVNIDPILAKETALAVFGLIQGSIQCGPLAGGKPGYFKRCGSEVAALVYKYLTDIIPNEDASRLLLFSDKQITAIEKWKSNAQAAAEQNKPPSKSMMAKREKASKSISKKKKK